MNQQKFWRNASLIIILLVSLLPPLSITNRAAASRVFAQGSGNTVTLETVTVVAGSSGSFAILLDNSDAVASGQLRFTYDATLGITITGVQVTDRTTGFASTGSAYATGDANLLGYQILFYNLNSLTVAPASGAILTIAYTTTATTSGSTALRFTQAILTNSLAQSLAVTPVNGSLTIQSETPTATATPTNTDVPPTATATPTNTDVPPTATATPTNTDVPPTATATPTNTDVPPTATATPGAEQLYISMSAPHKVNGIQINDEDIARYDAQNGTWTILFDGSNVGVAKTDVDAFHLWYEGNDILMSFDKPVRIPALGWVDDSDIVKFIPSSLGEGTTAGTFELFFDGSMVDLTSSGEDIDAIDFSPEGQLLISTNGTARVSGLEVKDEDLLAFAATGFGANTSGTWSLYFDGSELNLGRGSADVDGAFVASSGALYLTTKGDFSAVDMNGDSLSGKASDIFRCHPVVTGPVSSCALDLPFAEYRLDIDKDIDGLALAPNPGLSLILGASSLAVSDEIEQYEVGIDEHDADDQELDSFDLNVEELTTELFLPLIVR
ncbi:MAG: hypothetical protein R2911_27155 [Caldilineaceae bacterium]